MALAQFFDSSPTVPRPLTSDNLDWKWATSSDQLSDDFQHCQTRASENLEHSSLDESLLRHTVDIATPSCCPAFELVPHFVRIMFQLWRSLVCGNGNPSTYSDMVLWANPASLIPVRLHSFSTLLYVLNSVNSSMTKSGMKQLDGKGKWNVVTTTSRIVMMLFDEDEIFLDIYGESLEDLLQQDLNISKDKMESCAAESLRFQNGKENNGEDNSGITHEYLSPKKRASHSSTAELRPVNCDNDSSDIIKENSFSVISECSSCPSPDTGDSLITSPTSHASSSKDDLNLLDFIDKPMPLRIRSNSAPPSLKPLKIDSKTDFQSALNAGEMLNSPTGTNNPFSGPGLGPAANRRRWMTVPSLVLATIQEDNDKISENSRDSEGKGRTCVNEGTPAKEKSNPSTGDALDTELVLHKSKPSKVKQMRVPNIQSMQAEEIKLIGEKETKGPNDHQKSTGTTERKVPIKTVPKTDKEIETAGTAFLETIGKQFGYR